MAILGVAVALGGCSMLPHDKETSSTRPPPAPLETLSDADTMKQVVEPAATIVAVAALQDVSAGFDYEACNDQGEPPYRGRVDMGFRIPDDIEPKMYFQQLATRW